MKREYEAEREANRAMSCHGKIRHKSKVKAIAARDAMLRRPNWRKIVKHTDRDIRLEAYFCGHCDHWHLGHSAK